MPWSQLRTWICYGQVWNELILHWLIMLTCSFSDNNSSNRFEHLFNNHFQSAPAASFPVGCLPWNHDNKPNYQDFLLSGPTLLALNAIVCANVCICVPVSARVLTICRGWQEDYVILRLISINMTDYAVSDGRGLVLKDSLVCSGSEPPDLVNTTDALLSADE